MHGPQQNFSRYSCSFEGAAVRSAIPGERRALLLQAARHWRGVYEMRRNLARSYNSPDGFEAKLAEQSRLNAWACIQALRVGAYLGEAA